MKKSLIALAAAVLACTACGGGASDSKIVLFNGESLEGWKAVIEDNSYDVGKVFSISAEKTLAVAGVPNGYIRTEATYSNYRLHVEYRYPEILGNSGVFVHMQQGDNVWPVCLENQLQATNAGDYILMNGFATAEADPEQVAAKVQFNKVQKFENSSEFKLGEWNTMEVVCLEDTIETYVNGVLQNKGTNLTYSSGYICLQSEGSPIEFRNVWIEKIK
ncbi:MAG: DUF1080 domain-containing protein [Bacteroidales bacterium]|nr:DUF1080 domain-containing protein [Bacteroidales bacterium]